MSIVKNYHTISHDLQVHSALKHIEESEFLAFDTETTGLNVRKDTVIGMSFCGKAGTAYYVSRLSWNTETEQLDQMVSDEVFKSMVEKLAKKELLMWNASFDCRMVESNFNIDLLPSLAAEGMLMKHSVDEDALFALKRTGIELQHLIGLNVEQDANKEQIELKGNVAKNGGSTTQANYEMFKADLDIMSKYAAADADLTFRICTYYLEVLEQEGLSDFFFDKEVMPLFKEVTVGMEARGINLDLPMIFKAKEDIQVDIDYLEGVVLRNIMASPEFFKWKTDKILLNYPPKATGLFAQKYADYFKLDFPRTKTGKYSFSAKNFEGKEGIEYSALKDKDFSEVDKDDLFRISQECYDEKEEEFNISSKKQMGEIIFDYFKIKPLGRTPTGLPKFNDDFIEHLGTVGFDWTRDLSNYNKLIKIRGTYIDRFLDNQEDGIYYPTFKQYGTISGRYGSDLQQLPRPKEKGELDEIVLKHSNIIRGFFIAGKGRKFVDNDYESLEPHVFAHVSGDEGLRDIFRKGHDFYSTIAIQTEKLEGVSADKKADNYLGKVKKAVRQAAKAYALGVPYGMASYALGMTLGVTQAEAQVLIDGYLSGFPELKKWMDESELMAKTKGFVVSEVGRVRHLPRVKELFEKHGDRLLDYKYRATLAKKHTKRLGYKEAKKAVTKIYMEYKNGLNNAKNFQIQSLSASIVNLAAIEINREFIRRGIDGWVALQIHDQLVMNVPEEKAQECKVFIQDIMENNYKLSLDLKAPAELANNLLDGH